MLRRLNELGLLRRLDRAIGGLHAGSAAYIYAVTAAGQRLLSDPASRSRRLEPSLPFVAHTLAIADLYVELHQVTKCGPGELLKIETEPTCWRSWTGLSGERTASARSVCRSRCRRRRGAPFRRSRPRKRAPSGISAGKPGLTRRTTTAASSRHTRGVFPRVAWLVPNNERSRQLERAFTHERDLAPELFTDLTLQDGARALAR